MKLNTNIPKWLSHRADLFGNGVEGCGEGGVHTPCSSTWIRLPEVHDQKVKKGVPQENPNSIGENPAANVSDGLTCTIEYYR